MFKVKLVNFEHTSHLALVFLIVDFEEAMPPGSFHSMVTMATMVRVRRGAFRIQSNNYNEVFCENT